MKPMVELGSGAGAALRGLLAATMLVAAGCGASAKVPQSGNVIRFVRHPDLAPEFALEGLDGKPLSLGSVRGKVVLLNFWATWCGPCRAEIPDLIALQEKYAGKLQIIGLTVDEDDAGVVKEAVARTGINYPVAMTSPEMRMKYGGIAALPTSFVLDTEGRVVQKHEGLRDPLLYETEIRALLGLPIDARVETFEDTGQVFLAHADRASQLPGVDLSKMTTEGAARTAASRILFIAALAVSASGILSPPMALTAGILLGLTFAHPCAKFARESARFLLQASVVA